MEQKKRTYIVAQKVSYKKQIADASQKITHKAFLLGASLLAGVCSLIASMIEQNVSIKVVEKVVGLLNIGISAIELKDLIMITRSKFALNSKLEQVNSEIIEQDKKR